jgi:hypothetical protein
VSLPQKIHSTKLFKKKRTKTTRFSIEKGAIFAQQILLAPLENGIHTNCILQNFARIDKKTLKFAYTTRKLNSSKFIQLNTHLVFA